MTPLDERIHQIRQTYNACFGCGLDNDIGLHLNDFVVENHQLYAKFAPRSGFSGFAGLVHGGIVASALDETMAWTAMLIENVYVVTAKLELKYRKPAPQDAHYSMVGRISQRRGKRLVIAGEARVSDVLIAEATGLFLVTDPDQT